MKIFLKSTDEAWLMSVTEELERAGHQMTCFDQEEAAPEKQTVAVIEGAEEAARMAKLHPFLQVVALVDRDAVEDVAPEVETFVVKPPARGEIALRIKLISDRAAHGGDTTRTRLLATAVESAGDVIEISDPNAVLEYVNGAFESLFEYEAREVMGKTPAQLVRSDMHEPGFFEKLEETLSAGEVWSGLLISRTKSGRLVHLETTISPVSNASGEITHHVAVKRDITERLKHEEALEQTNRALEHARDAALAASRSKSEFLANMSHELRTPLNAIIGYSEMLEEDAREAGDDALAADLEKVRNAGAHLLDLINDVLDLSKIEAGRMDLFIEELNLGELIQIVATTVIPMARSRGNEFEVDCPDDLGVMIADVRKVKQTLLNLLSNALKFTESGTVTLRVQPETRGGDDWIRFEVVDTGIGMTAAQQEKLFQPFVQADASTTKKYGGTGLGLTISQRFCEMMGGSISVSSEVGLGATFTVLLPRKIQELTKRRSIAPAGAVHTVLVIDDDPTIHDLLARSLGRAGYRVECVSGGEEGLEMARTLKPDAIVLDVVMPGMDGWSVLTDLKVDAETAAIPVVMLTILDQTDLGATMGAVDYFVKPVDPARLVKAIHRHIAANRDALVLVVEDHAPTRELVCRTLEGAGCRVAEAANGRVGLDSIAAHTPDLIVLDLMMPEMDGFEFLDNVRSEEALRHIPVIISTAKELTSGERRRLEKSAQRIIEKNHHTRTELLRVIDVEVARVLEPGSGPPPDE